MRPAPPHPDEDRRLAAVHALGLLGTAPERRFDQLTEMAAAVFDVPIALISLIDRDRQWFKSRVGIETAEFPRELGFCSHAILDAADAVLVVEEAMLDDRFFDNPLVRGEPNIRFYAGLALRDEHGLPVGTLSLIDRRPRILDPARQRAFRSMAALAEQELRRTGEAELVDALAKSQERRAIILQTIDEGVVLQDAHGQITRWNPAAARLLGLDHERTDHQPATHHPPPAGPTWGSTRIDGSPWTVDTHPATVALRTQQPVRGAIMGVRHPSGRHHWLRINAQPIIDELGRCEQVLTTFTDVTTEVDETHHRQLLEDALRRNEQITRHSLNALHEGVAVVDRSGFVMDMNAAAERILGYTREELSQRWSDGSWETFDRHGELIPFEQRPMERAASTGQAVIDEQVGWNRRDGVRIVVRLSVVPNADDADGAIVTFTEVTEQQPSEPSKPSMPDLALFSHLLQRTNDIITVIDADGRVLYANPSNERVLGYPDDYRHPEGIIGFVHPDDRELAINEISQLVAGRDGSEPFNVRVVAFDGSTRHVTWEVANLLSDPVVGGIVITARDITDQVRLTEQLAQRARHDALTGLPNRQLLEDAVTAGLDRRPRDASTIAVLFIDLDGFRSVNIALGHAAGDRLLMSVAARISDAIRGDDLAARIGSDEFAILLDQVSDGKQAVAVAKRILGLLGPEQLSPDGPPCSVSIGVAIGELGDTVSGLLNRAEAAMVRAKTAGGASIELG